MTPTKKIQFPPHIKEQIKSEIINELESRKVRLDNEDLEFVLSKAKELIESNKPRFDNQEIISSILKQAQLSEQEKQLAFNKEKIWTKEVRTDFIDDILNKIELPENGKQGKKGEKGKDGKDYKLTEQDRLDISKEVDLKDVVKKTDLSKTLTQFVKDIWTKKIKLPAQSGGSVKNIYEKYLKVTPTGDDEGLRVENGQLSVGTHLQGQETVLGAGDSHTNGMVVLTTQDDITYIDETVNAASDNGSAYDVFGGIAVGATSYIGSDEQFCGIKLKTAELLDPGTGAVAREFWNGTVWDTFTAMATGANPPYTQRADNIGTVIGSEQVRFGSCDTQAKTTINGLEKYWVRFRVTSAIDVDGKNEQIKLHTNRFEVNEDGFTEHYGDAIYERDLLVHWGLSEELVGFSPQNKTITFASGLSLAYLANQLNNAQTSGRGGIVEIPIGMDTSRGIIGEVLFTPLASGAGDILWEAVTYQTKVGDTLSIANTPVSQLAATPIESDTANKLYKIQIPVDVQNLLPGEILTFGIKRVGGDVLDTFVGNIALVNVRAIGLFWHP